MPQTHAGIIPSIPFLLGLDVDVAYDLCAVGWSSCQKKNGAAFSVWRRGITKQKVEEDKESEYKSLFNSASVYQDSWRTLVALCHPHHPYYIFLFSLTVALAVKQHYQELAQRHAWWNVTSGGLAFGEHQGLRGPSRGGLQCWVVSRVRLELVSVDEFT